MSTNESACTTLPPWPRLHRSQTSSCPHGLASIAQSESAWLWFHPLISKEKEEGKSHNPDSHIERRVATGAEGFVLVFKGQASVHLRSAAFDVRSERYKHLFLFFFLFCVCVCVCVFCAVQPICQSTTMFPAPLRFPCQRGRRRDKKARGLSGSARPQPRFCRLSCVK